MIFITAGIVKTREDILDKINKPTLLISRCLMYEHCRWDGRSNLNIFVKQLEPFVKYITVCPEIEIGLGVPREPIKIVFSDNKYTLEQLNTKKDITGKMKNFSENYANILKNIDGIILKSKSPSCGIETAEVFSDLDSSKAIGKTNGFFSREILEKFKNLPIETEGSLEDKFIRESFIKRIFTEEKFKEIKGKLGKNKKVVKET